MSSTSTDVRKRCKVCLEYVKIYITCFKCEAIYHIYCWKKVPGAYVYETGQLFCCLSLTSNCAGTDTKLGTQNDPLEQVMETGNVDDYNKDLETRPIKEEEDSAWNEFKCDACLLEFTNKEHLENHYSECSNKAGELIQVLMEDKDLENFLDKEDDLEWNEFRCDACLLGFTNKDHLQNHYNKCSIKEGEFVQQLKVDKAGLACTFRNEENVQQETYEYHMKRCDIESSCSQLKKDNDDTCVTKMIRNLTQDKHKQKKYECLNCKYFTYKKADLVTHMFVHTNKKSFKCDTCKYAAANRQDLRVHILRTHSNPEKQYKCKDCEYSSYRKTKLLEHKRTHTNEKPFKCKMCDYTAALKTSLSTHVLVKHSNAEKMYKCGNCEYSAHTKANLLSHERTHTTQRPYKCDTCTYTATRKSHLSFHILRKHSKAEKQYKCRDCKYCTHTKYRLLEHKRTHTKEKPFKCAMCDYAAALKNNLRKHIIGKHSDTE